MRQNRFQNRITAGRLTLPVSILLSLVCWTVAALLLPSPTAAKPAEEYSLWQMLGFPGLSDGISLAAGYLLYSLAAWLLILLNNTYAIIRMRASVQTVVYILLVAVCSTLHPWHAGNVAALALVLALFFLFGSYQHSQPAANVFHAFVFLGAGSMALPQLTFLVPVFWIGAYNFKALQPKSFVASLLGWSLPYWFLLGHAYFYGEMKLFYQPFRELVRFTPVAQGWLLYEIAPLAYLLVLLMVSAAHCLVAGYEDKIRTRSYLHFLIFLSFCLLVFTVLQPPLAVHLLPLLLVPGCILVGHLFVLTSSRASNVFFIAALAGLFLLFGFNLWMLL